MTYNQIIDICKKNAIYLLEKFSEFYPFAYGMTAGDNAVPVATFSGDDFPLSDQLILELKLALKESHKDNDFKEACIVVDVSDTHPQTQEKTDCIEIRINCRDAEPINYYIPYKLANAKVDTGIEYYRDGEKFINL